LKLTFLLDYGSPPRLDCQFGKKVMTAQDFRKTEIRQWAGPSVKMSSLSRGKMGENVLETYRDPIR
jgi:hypothetical protein